MGALQSMSVSKKESVCSRVKRSAPSSRTRKGELPVVSTSSATNCASPRDNRSEEHTSELQSPYDLVCRLLLEKKKIRKSHYMTTTVKDSDMHVASPPVLIQR